MADAQSSPDLRRARAAAQLLTDSKRRSPSEIVRHLLAVQAQDFTSFPLALRARSKGLKRSDVYAALDSGELIVSWLNRCTLHLVCREDYWWLHSLTAPTLRTTSARWLEKAGVTNPAAKVKATAKVLANGPMVRKAIGERIGLSGQTLTHLLLQASIDGVVVRGPVSGREQTFILAADHVGEPPAIDREQALTELATRYAKGHSPSTDADLAHWAKLPLGAVRGRMPDARRTRHSRPVRPLLLPAFDPYIMGWKDRSFTIRPEHSTDVIPGGGMFRAVVLVDGVVAGTWSKAGGKVSVAPLEELPDLSAEIADVERFLAQ